MPTKFRILRFTLLIFFLAALGPGHGLTETLTGPPPSKANYLVLISIDACRPDYFPLADIPHIKSLMKEGVSYNRAWVGQLRNNTPPGQTTMATGTFPKNNGILCFGWRDPSNKTGSPPTSWKNVTSGYMNGLIARSGTTSIGTLYKKAHPEAKVAAISSDKFYAAAGLGAQSADFILFSRSGDVADFRYMADNDLIPDGVQGHLAPAEIMNDPGLKRSKSEKWDSDSWAVDLAIKLFEKEKPRIMMINLPDTDEAGHATGGITNPKAMGRIITRADVQIGRLIEAYKKAGVYDQTVFVITSDHGMTPSLHYISQDNIKSILWQSGTWGNPQPEFYLGNPAKAGEVAENIAKTKIAGIHGVYFKAKASDGSYVYLPSPTTAGAITGDLDKSFRYLTGTYASEKSPDVFLVIAENWRQDYHLMGFKMPGSHDTVTWLSQHIPLIISGPGINKGALSDNPARLVDIAPTVLTLMGVAPERMDGIVLADALANPSAEQSADQARMNDKLIPLVKALKALSDSDLAEEK
jgi:predicted AlkP superfamily pyrophosphatase or phosphodiesterase